MKSHSYFIYHCFFSFFPKNIVYSGDPHGEWRRSQYITRDEIAGRLSQIYDIVFLKQAISAIPPAPAKVCVTPNNVMRGAARYRNGLNLALAFFSRAPFGVSP